MKSSRGKLARMVNGGQTVLIHCLTGKLTCRRCGKQSTAAVETAFGFRPACRECAEQGEKKGYKIIWKLPDGPGVEP